MTLVSLPSRERGLKFRKANRNGYWSLSLPSRERGLKLSPAAKFIVTLCRSLRGSAD